MRPSEIAAGVGVVCLLLALLTWLLVNGRGPRSMRIRFSGRRLRSSPSRARTIPLGHSPHDRHYAIRDASTRLIAPLI